ncbi:MAG: response regulator transcription factor [Candidatus Thiodiazotropha sp. (ex Monitilora ramsayi)]|nr:response regulator transcription factor [Candidatus Thiodiazotropha sp. (ex Monitilora ramsayi)]
MNVVLADDHAIFREGLKLLLGTRPDFNVVAEFDNVQALKEYVQNQPPELVILDYHMPNEDTLACIDYLKTRFAAMKVMVLTGSQSATILQQLVKSKADAVLLKEGSGKQMLSAIQQVQHGKRLIAEQVQALLDHLPAELTTREFQILTQLVRGLSSKEIADMLSIAPKTVDKHRENLMKKLQVSNVAQLLNVAHQLHLLD